MSYVIHPYHIKSTRHLNKTNSQEYGIQSIIIMESSRVCDIAIAIASVMGIKSENIIEKEEKFIVPIDPYYNNNNGTIRTTKWWFDEWFQFWMLCACCVHIVCPEVPFSPLSTSFPSVSSLLSSLVSLLRR